MPVLRALIAAVAIALMAVTPLSAVLEPSRHVTLFPGTEYQTALPVVLDDRTGLVANVAAVGGAPEGVTNVAGNARALLIGWLGGACDYLVSMVFERREGGFRLELRTDRASGCILLGVRRSVLIRLRSPVDATTVTFTISER